MDFQHLEYLWLLLLVPALSLVYLSFLSWRKKGIRRLGNPVLVRQQLLGNINGRHTSRFVMMMAALVLIVIGLMNMRKGTASENDERKGVDVIFAMDVSQSMLAGDVEPDRLSRAKHLIESVMDQMKNNRVGLVLFAGNAYLDAPLTVDFTTVKTMLSGAQPADLPMKGTAIGSAILVANRSFSSKEQKYKALVLISDGEDHDDNALKAAKQSAESGVVIFTVGIGSPQGATIKDPLTGEQKLDAKGNPVITKLNEQELKEIADATEGNYFLLNNTARVATAISKELSAMDGKNLGTLHFTSFKSYYRYFLAAALLLLIAEWLLAGSSKTSITQKTGYAA